MEHKIAIDLGNSNTSITEYINGQLKSFLIDGEFILSILLFAHNQIAIL